MLRMAPARTRRVADADFKTGMHCIADADYLPTSTAQQKDVTIVKDKTKEMVAKAVCVVRGNCPIC